MLINVSQMRFGKSLGFLLLPLFLLILLFTQKALFFVAWFISLDFIINLAKSTFHLRDIPFDSITFGSFFIAYTFGFKYAIFLVPFAVITQIFFSIIEARHIWKFGTLAICTYLASISSFFSIAFAVTFIYALRYILDYSIEFLIFRSLDLSRIGVRMLNLIICYIILIF